MILRKGLAVLSDVLIELSLHSCQAVCCALVSTSGVALCESSQVGSPVGSELAVEGSGEVAVVSDVAGTLDGSQSLNDFGSVVSNVAVHVRQRCRSRTANKLSVYKQGKQRMYKNGRTPVYPMLYAQVTRRFKGWDVYVGAENLTNFTQKNPIVGGDNPRQASFDASCIWGPLMGIKAHIGFRFTLWKKA